MDGAWISRWVDETHDYARGRKLSIELRLTRHGVQVQHRCASITVHWAELNPESDNLFLKALKSLEIMDT